MMRTSKELLVLAFALGFAACNKSNPPGTPSIAFVSPLDGAVLTADAGMRSNGLLTFQVTASVSNAPAGSMVKLTAGTVNGSTAAAPASGSGEVTLSITLSGGDPATPYMLELELDSAAGTKLATATINITVLLTSTGACSITISPPNGSLFNESGTAVPNYNTVQDTDLTTAGMQATLTVTVGSPCPDGPVTLVLGDGSGVQPAPVTSQNGVATFTGITLPETTAAALFDTTKLLPVTANAGTGAEASSDTVHYIVDSMIPACTISSPLDGAMLTMTDDVDASTPGIQIDVSGTCQGFVGGELISIIDPTTGNSYGTGTIKSGDTFSVEVTVLAGANALTLSGSSLTGNPATSNTVIATVINGTNCADAGIPTVTFTAPTLDAGFNLANDTDAFTAGFQTTLMINTSSMTGKAEFCSSVAPKPGVVTPCSFDANLFEIGHTVSVSGGDATLADATLGDDGAAPDQTLTAQVTDGTCGTQGKGTQLIEVHAIQPVIDSAVVQNTSGPPDGGCFWLNAANLQNGTAQTTVAVTSTIDVADMFDGGPTLTITGTTKQTDSASLTGSGTQSAQVPISLPDGTYQVSATITDVWGNQSAADQFNICVKTSLPTCTISDNYSNSCFNIQDNAAGATGNVPVPVGITVDATNASATDISGNPIDGTVSVSNGGAPTSDPIDGGLTVMVSSAQGPNAYSATVTDPAGNLADCTPPSLGLTVSTVAPTMTVTAVSSGNGQDDGGCEIYLTRDGISVGVATTGIADGTSINVQGTGANGGIANTAATVASNAASATLNGLPNGVDIVTASGTDSCGNPGTGSACIDVQAAGCDLSLVSPVPISTDLGEVVVFSASLVADGGTGSIEFHTSCGAGTEVDFSSTPSGGSAQPQSADVDANGDVTFDLTGLVDGSSGTFTADIAGGESLPTLAYAAKFTLPAFTGETPAAGNLEVVASQDNLILNDAGLTTLVNAGGTIVASEGQCASNACADFTLSGISGLGPVDGNGNIGTATLTLNFPGFTTSNPSAINIANGSTTVTFSGVDMPQVATGTVTLTLTDNVGNTTIETWSVTTDSLQPPAPALTAAMADKRKASVLLSWTVPASNGDSATQGYELAYIVNNLSATPPTTPSEATYATWTLDPGIAGVVGTALTYTSSPPFATLNQYTFELRAIDVVGNRSALAASATAVSVSVADSNAWQTVTLLDPTDAGADSDFGYVLRTGDFNGDGLQDLAITAPYQYASNPTPGIVYILSGAADLSKVTSTGLTPITLGGTDYDYFGQDAHVADFNCDGIDDLAVGSPEYNNGQGRVDIFFGSAAGIATTPSTTIVGDSTTAGQFGFSVSSANVNGDKVNGHPCQDLIVGAPAMGNSNNGASYVFLGSGNWPLPNAGTDVTSATCKISGNAGDAIGARWGTVGLGDIDGDGDEDIAIGAPGGGGSNGASGSGSEYGFSGTTLLTNTPIDLSTTAGTSLLLFDLVGRVGGFCDPNNYGYNSGGFWSCFGVDAIDADFTGGALNDLIVSSSQLQGIFLYTMTKTGPVTPAAFTDGSEDEAAGGNVGWSMVASDINGDKSQDLLAGQNNSGSPNVYLYLNTGTGLTAFTTTTGGELFGPDGGYFGYGVAAGDFQGIGKQDFAISDVYPWAYVNVYY